MTKGHSPTADVASRARPLRLELGGDHLIPVSSGLAAVLVGRPVFPLRRLMRRGVEAGRLGLRAAADEQ